MSNITNLNFPLSALTIFHPNGKITCINKKKGYNLHIEYLKVLCKNDKEIKKLLSGINMNYYLENPNKVITDIMPIFAKNNYSVYINLNPNILKPTNYSFFILPEKIPKSTKTLLNKMKENLSEIIFLDIAKFNNETNYFESYLDNSCDQEPNADKLFEIINDTPVTNKARQNRK